MSITQYKLEIHQDPPVVIATQCCTCDLLYEGDFVGRCIECGRLAMKRIYSKKDLDYEVKVNRHYYYLLEKAKNKITYRERKIK